LWVGRLNVGKDPMTVINAFEKYIIACPQARLFMIYQTEELLPVIKRKLAENMQLQKAVILKGKVDHAEIEIWYNAADYFISGSHKEGSGYALIEAMSCGCIPVVTNIPSFKKITLNGTFGFLFECENSQNLLTLLFNLKNIEKEKLSKSLITHFNNSLSFKSIADDLFSICERLMDE
jgi:glycosyltransferase involved in cell wall biosynthesis